MMLLRVCHIYAHLNFYFYLEPWQRREQGPPVLGASQSLALVTYDYLVFHLYQGRGDAQFA